MEVNIHYWLINLRQILFKRAGHCKLLLINFDAYFIEKHNMINDFHYKKNEKLG